MPSYRQHSTVNMILIANSYHHRWCDLPWPFHYSTNVCLIVSTSNPRPIYRRNDSECKPAQLARKVTR